MRIYRVLFLALLIASLVAHAKGFLPAGFSRGA